MDDFLFDPSDEEKAAAMSAALRRQQSMGILAQLTGDKVLSGVGQNIAQNAQQQQQMTAQQAFQKLMKGQEQQFTGDQNDLDRSLRAKELRERSLDRLLQRESMLAMLKDKQAAKKEEVQTKDTKELSEDVEKMGGPGFYQKYDDAKAIIDEDPSDLPGMGFFAGRMPDLLTSQKGVDLRQSIGQMLAEYRKGITGAGMSNAERVEYGNITGLLQGGDEKAVKTGIDRLRRNMDARISNRADGSPASAADLSSRQPWLKGAMDRSEGESAPAGLSADKKARLDELRRKRAAGEIK